MTSRQQKLCAVFGGISTRTNTIHTSWLPPFHPMILYSANLVVPAAVRHSIDNLDGYFLCTAVYVSQPQEAYTHSYYQSPQLGDVAAAATLGLDKVACACFILITHDGPTLLCLETRERERGVRRGVQGVCWWSPTQPWRAPICFVLSWHSLLQVSQTRAWPLNPKPPSPFLHTYTAKAACLLLVHCYAKEFFFLSFIASTLSTGADPCKSQLCLSLTFFPWELKRQFSLILALFSVYSMSKVTQISKSAQSDSCRHHLLIHIWPA